MLPTPAKFHYVFNMRELSRIFKGILTCKKDTINEAMKSIKIKPELFIVGLWRHEAERVLADKLVNQKDKDVVLGFI
jgi:dynein heavy chain